MAYTDTDADDESTDAVETSEVLDWNPDEADAAELAENLATTCKVLVEEIGVEQDETFQGIPVGLLVQNAIPGIQRYAYDRPELAMQAVARMYLESRALLDAHAPDTDPEDLLD